MSYSLYLETTPCPACGEVEGRTVWECNITYNLAKIIDHCLTAGAAPSGHDEQGRVRHAWYRLEGLTSAQMVPILEKAVAAATDPSLRQYEPANGWGKLENVQAALAGLLENVRRYRNLRLVVH